MNITIFKSILIGLLIGLLAFVAGRFVIVALLLAAIFKLSGMGNHKKEHRRSRKLAFANKVRSMTEEEFKNFTSKVGEDANQTINTENK